MADDFSSLLSSVSDSGGTGLKTPAGDLSKTIGSIVSGFDKKAGETVDAMKNVEDKYREPLQKNIAEQHALLEKMKATETPTPPELKDLPDSPDTQHKDPTQALGSMASALAMLGSLRTRAPLTSALNSGAAAMEGFHKGDQERIKLERDKFHDELEKGLRQNQEEMAKYTAALQKSNFDMTKAHGELTALASQFKDEQMLAAMESGNVQMQYQIFTDRSKLGLEITKVLSSEKTRLAQIEAHKQEHADTVVTQKEIAGMRLDASRDASGAKGWKMYQSPDGGMFRVNENAGVTQHRTKDGAWEDVNDMPANAVHIGAKMGVSNTTRDRIVQGAVDNSLRQLEEFKTNHPGDIRVSNFFGTHPEGVMGKTTNYAGRQILLSSEQKTKDADAAGIIDEMIPVFTGGLRSSDSYRQFLMSQFPNQGDDEKSAARKMKLIEDNINGVSNIFRSKFAASPKMWDKGVTPKDVSEIAPEGSGGGSAAPALPPGWTVKEH